MDEAVHTRLAGRGGCPGGPGVVHSVERLGAARSNDGHEVDHGLSARECLAERRRIADVGDSNLASGVTQRADILRGAHDTAYGASLLAEVMDQPEADEPTGSGHGHGSRCCGPGRHARILAGAYHDKLREAEKAVFGRSIRDGPQGIGRAPREGAGNLERILDRMVPSQELGDFLHLPVALRRAQQGEQPASIGR
jgi:hypothetical protein